MLIQYVLTQLTMSCAILGIASVYGVFIFLGILSLFFGLVILLISKLPVPERFSLGYLALVLVIVALLSVARLLALPALWWLCSSSLPCSASSSSCCHKPGRAT